MRSGPFFGSDSIGLGLGLADRGRALAIACLLGAAVLALGSCKPSGDLSCREGLSCPDGQRCVVAGVDDPGMCLLSCASSTSCAEAAPICDATQSVCRSCFPGEDAVCQKRDPQYSRCGGGRCVQCLSKRSDSAEAPECQTAASGMLVGTPVCDKAKNTCRACQRHSECDSGVCAKDQSGASLGVPQGSCVPVGQVLIVDQDLCTSDGPVFCSAKQALTHTDAQHRYVLVRKSAVPSDFTDLKITGHQADPLWLIGPLADMAPASLTTVLTVSLGGIDTLDALTITDSNVVIEGLAIRGSNSGVVCLASSHVRVVRSLLADNGTAVVASAGCSLSVEQSWFGRGPQGSTFAGPVSDTRNARSLDITGSDFWVTNSVFADNGDLRVDGFGGVRVHSLSVGKTRSGIINSTFMQQSALIKSGKYYAGVLCDAAAGDRLVVMNSLFYTDAPLRVTPEDHYIDPSCGASLHHNASNDALLTDDKSLVLPMNALPFVDAAARNLHLGPRLTVGGSSLDDGGAAAIDFPTPERIAAPTVDMDGLVRGTTISIGAYSALPKS